MKRLLFIVLILAACEAWAQTHTEMTLEDNQSATSQKTFSNPGVFNNSLVNGYITSLVNNCVPLTELSGPGVIGGTVTSGVVACTAIPAARVRLVQGWLGWQITGL